MKSFQNRLQLTNKYKIKIRRKDKERDVKAKCRRKSVGLMNAIQEAMRQMMPKCTAKLSKMNEQEQPVAFQSMYKREDK